MSAGIIELQFFTPFILFDRLFTHCNLLLLLMKV